MEENKTKKVYFNSLIAITLVIAIILGSTPVMNMEAKKIDSIGEEYARILAKYKTVFDEAQKLNYDFNYEEIDVNPEFFMASLYTSAYQPILLYKIFDFNKDDIPELFIAILFGDDSDQAGIFDAYTYYKGEAVRIVDYGIGERAGTCSFCKNGVIENAGSGGAYFTEIKYQKMKKKQKKITTFLTISWIEGVCKKKENGQTEIISEEQYEKIRKQYGKRIKMKFYEYTDKVIENVMNDEYTLEGQKVRRVFT